MWGILYSRFTKAVFWLPKWWHLSTPRHFAMFMVLVWNPELWQSQDLAQSLLGARGQLTRSHSRRSNKKLIVVKIFFVVYQFVPPLLDLATGVSMPMFLLGNQH